MKRHIAAISLLVMAAGIVASADTLVLTNGRRISGELLGVFGREIEFEERNGFGRRIIRVPRVEIDRIEFAKMARIAELIHATALRVGNLERPPARDFAGPRIGKGKTGPIR